MYQDSLGKSAHLSDRELVLQFENGTLPKNRFGHPDHVRVAWIYLRRTGLPEAIESFSVALRRFASAHGTPGRYHETVTWAFMILIHQRMYQDPECDRWEVFAGRNPDLLRWKGGAFFDHYPPDILKSEEARAVFVLPRCHAELES